MATTIDLGKIRIKWKGDYDASLTYELLDVIKFKGDSYIFISTISASGKTPDTTSEWELMVSGGDQWSTGTAAPSGGNPGDMYLRTSDETIHENSGGTWSQTANLGVTGTNIEQLANVPALSSGKFLTNDGTNTSWATVDVHGTTVGGDVTGTVANMQLIANSVGAAEIAANAVGQGELADGAVDTNAIANSAVTDAKISGMAASKLTGSLPGIDGSALTNLPITTPPTLSHGYGNLEVVLWSDATWSKSGARPWTTPMFTFNRRCVVLCQTEGHMNAHRTYMRIQMDNVDAESLATAAKKIQGDVNTNHWYGDSDYGAWRGFVAHGSFVVEAGSTHNFSLYSDGGGDVNGSGITMTIIPVDY